MRSASWSRALYRVSRALSAVDIAQQVLRDEMFFAFLAPNQRAAVTFDAYAKSSHYVPGGETFSAGLFGWESALLADPRVPQSGRVLLGAAGGGRELKALLERGYDVCAFEPVETLRESARKIASNASAIVVDATYDDLVQRAAGRPGKLDTFSGDFDFCILGWGSLSHLTEPEAVVELLRAVRALSPRAPILTSFLLRPAGPPPTNGGANKLRRLVRRSLRALGGRSVTPGLRFLTSAGFMYSFSREELFGLCAEAGYAVAHFGDSHYPHALLLPADSARADSPASD